MIKIKIKAMFTFDNIAFEERKKLFTYKVSCGTVKESYKWSKTCSFTLAHAKKQMKKWRLRLGNEIFENCIDGTQEHFLYGRTL